MENKILNKTVNGLVFQCKTCNKIHIEFKNLNFNFEKDEYNQFTHYISHLNGKKWENLNLESQYKRKIVIPIGHRFFRILLNNTELTELKHLFNPDDQQNMNFRVINASDLFRTHCNN